MLTVTRIAYRTILAGSLCGMLLGSASPARAQAAPPGDVKVVLHDVATFDRLADRARNDPSTLNQERFEDYKEFTRLTTLARQVKLYCPSLLSEVLSLPEVPVIASLSPGLKSLWVEAANRPETGLRLQAAEAISRASRFRGADFKDTVPLLVKMLDAPQSERIVRLAAARALIAVISLDPGDARDVAPLLAKHATDGLEFGQLIEPRLASWNDRSMESTWLSRLEQKDTASGPLLLAMEAAATIRLEAAVPHLIARVQDPHGAPHLRMEAARALGAFADESVIPIARRLASTGRTSPAVLAPLLAAHMLLGQTAEDAVVLLQQLAANKEPAVAGVAFGRLLQVGSGPVQSTLAHVIGSSDPGLRKQAAHALYRLQTPETVSQLGKLLGDQNLSVRSTAQLLLIHSAANDGLRDAVHATVTDMLKSDQPRGIAQAAIVVGRIELKTAADRLVELLNHDARDVSIAAAWALRRIAVESTAEPIFRHLSGQVERSQVEIPFSDKSDLSWIWDMYEQQKHLIEAMGVLRYAPADSLLRSFLAVPLGKPLNHPFHWIHSNHRAELRARAIWALGRLKRDRLPPELVPRLLEILDDGEEPLSLSAAAALSLGELKVADALPALRQYDTPDVHYTEAFPRPSLMAHAARVALRTMTGEALPPLVVDPFIKNETGWFLEPVASTGAR